MGIVIEILEFLGNGFIVILFVVELLLLLCPNPVRESTWPKVAAVDNRIIVQPEERERGDGCILWE